MATDLEAVAKLHEKWAAACADIEPGECVVHTEAAATIRAAMREIALWRDMGDGLSEEPMTAADNAMIDAAWEKHKAAAACNLPPPGWWCSRGAGHEGPCAARCDAGTGERP